MSDIESDEEIVDEEVENSDDEEEDIELTLKEQVSGVENSVIRAKKIIEVPHDQRRTSNYITKTELVEIIGTRAALIERGAPAYVQIGDLKNPIHIAVKELLEGQNPQKIQRIIYETDTEKVVEIWEVRSMIANLENYIEIVPETMFQKIQDSINSISTPAKTKTGGNEIRETKKRTPIPPIIYWYNGTHREKYNFMQPELIEKFNALGNGTTYAESSTDFSKSLNLGKRSEFEKLLATHKTRSEDYYIYTKDDYARITRLLATIAIFNSNAVMVDIEIDRDSPNSLSVCALQIIGYYYKTIKYETLDSGKKLILHISASDREEVHPFYTQSLVNLIDLPEVRSIFLVSDLMKL